MGWGDLPDGARPREIGGVVAAAGDKVRKFKVGMIVGVSCMVGSCQE